MDRGTAGIQYMEPGDTGPRSSTSGTAVASLAQTKENNRGFCSALVFTAQLRTTVTVTINAPLDTAWMAGPAANNKRAVGQTRATYRTIRS